MLTADRGVWSDRVAFPLVPAETARQVHELVTDPATGQAL
jgi:hypothetical protein